MSTPPTNEGSHWRTTKAKKRGCGLLLLGLLAMVGMATIFTLGACAVWS